jgi:hypothetical protein
MRTYTITDKQISAIHNGMCEIRFLMSHFEEMFKEDSHLNQKLKRAFEYIEPVRKELMDKKDDDFDRVHKLANQMAERHSIRYTIWSIYEIESFDERSNVPEGATIIAPWETDKSIQVKGPSWMDLWLTVEELAGMTEDEDGHKGFGSHAFIEKFVRVADKENTFEVYLGS